MQHKPTQTLLPFLSALILFPLITPAAHAEQVRDVAPGSTEYAAIVAPLHQVMEAELQQPVALHTNLVRTDGDFAFVAAEVTRPDGTPLDFRETVYVDAITSGLFDGPHLWALLGMDESAWTVLEHDIGPTDAYFFSWPSSHGAGCALLGDGIETC